MSAARPGHHVLATVSPVLVPPKPDIGLASMPLTHRKTQRARDDSNIQPFLSVVIAAASVGVGWRPSVQVNEGALSAGVRLVPAEFAGLAVSLAVNEETPPADTKRC